jgi:hypothetical protein
VAVTASAQSTTQGVGTVVRVEGLASYSLDGGTKWIPLVAGQHLPPGSQIHTGYNGIVDVVLGKAVPLPEAAWQPDRISQAADSPVRGLVTYKPSTEQNVIRLTPDSTLSIDKLTIVDTGSDSVGDTELNLTQGKIFGSVKKLSGASQYLVKFKNGVAGVRGTTFSITDQGYTVVFQTHDNGGLVISITSPAGTTSTIVVPASSSFDPAGGGTPVNLTPQEVQVLQKVFSTVKTVYGVNVGLSFSDDKTTVVYVSTVSGVGGSSSTPSPAPGPGPTPY